MYPGSNILPIDKTVILTQLSIHPDLFNNPKTFIHGHDLPIRTIKPTRGRGANKLNLDVLTYKGIKVKLANTDGGFLTNATIEFNPGVCLYGHNGRILSLSEFLEALALLVTHLKPLLNNPDDWVDLVPGVRKGGRAFWAYLEVLFHFLDPDGTFLSSFRHARHPSIKTVTRHWPTSIQMGGRRGKLQFSIYQKAVEMVASGKLTESEFRKFKDILRLEARMREEKLVHYFGNERNVEEIDGENRLCRFYPQDLVGGLRKSFSEMEGVYYFSGEQSKETSNGKEQLEPLGRLLAVAALDARTPQSLSELVYLLKVYTGASTDTIRTIGKIRKAALAELSRRSSLSFDDLFSDSAYCAQPEISIPDIEQKISRPLEDMHAHPLITAAYRPPDPLFHPDTEGRRYIRSKPDHPSRKQP
jgi:hypothetical protein